MRKTGRSVCAGSDDETEATGDRWKSVTISRGRARTPLWRRGRLADPEMATCHISTLAIRGPAILALLRQRDELRPLPVLTYAIDGKRLAMHHHPNAGREHAGGEQTLGQVLQAVAAFESQRCHRASEDDRDR